MGASSWNQISIGLFSGTSAGRAFKTSPRSFESCHDPLARLGMARAGADVGRPERLEQFADAAPMIGDAETGGDHRLPIDAAPAHDAVHLWDRTGLDDLCQGGQLLRRQPSLPSLR